jgi:tRNA1(Val) A37 N6-methylase TrmN6
VTRAPRPAVRPPRRPPGWTAPGPRPAEPPPADVVAGPREDFSYLTGDWQILQRTDGHRWSADDLLTAWYAAEAVAATPPARALDLGCGVGSVLLMIAWRFPSARMVGVEAQAVSFELLRKSLRWNGCADRVDARLGDLRDPTMVPEGAVFDLVTGTPPYFPPGQGRESDHVQRGPCRFEHRGGVEDYLAAMARTLAPDGIGALCSAAMQLPRVEAGARAAGLTIVRRRDVIPRVGKAPLIGLYLVKRKSDETASTLVEEPMVIRAADGLFTPEYDAVRAAMGMPVFTRRG